MRILLIADPHIPVPPIRYGGAERALALYGTELERLGHKVNLLAGQGSLPFSGKLFLHQAPTNKITSRAYRKILFQLLSLKAFRECDVVYNYGRFDYLEILLRLKIPILHCFQNQIDQNQIDFAEKRIRSNLIFHCISNDQLAHAKLNTPSVVVHNPVDTSFYDYRQEPGKYLAFLGRLTYNKGIDIAIEASIRSQKKLIIAGNIPDEEGAREYFSRFIKPKIDGDQVVWIGPVDDYQKQNLLANAEALLFPIRWDEPFGIVMVESLACGTPVIATNRASVPEVIENAKTGFICDNSLPNVDTFVDAIKKLPLINRIDCRKSAENRFDIKTLTPKIANTMQSLIK